MMLFLFHRVYYMCWARSTATQAHHTVIRRRVCISGSCKTYNPTRFQKKNDDEDLKNSGIDCDEYTFVKHSREASLIRIRVYTCDVYDIRLIYAYIRSFSGGSRLRQHTLPSISKLHSPVDAPMFFDDEVQLSQREDHGSRIEVRTKWWGRCCNKAACMIPNHQPWSLVNVQLQQKLITQPRSTISNNWPHLLLAVWKAHAVAYQMCRRSRDKEKQFPGSKSTTRSKTLMKQASLTHRQSLVSPIFVDDAVDHEGADQKSVTLTY